MTDVAGTHIVDRDQPPLSSEQTEVIREFHDLYYTRWAKRAAIRSTSVGSDIKP